MTEIIYNGILYASYSELHAAHSAPGVSYACFFGRMKGGWQMTDALTQPPNRSMRRTYKVGDRVFKDLAALADAAGITYEAAVKRRDRGATDEEIFHGRHKPAKLKKADADFATMKKKLSPHVVTIAGCDYDSLSHAYDKLSPTATFNAVRARIRYGQTFEQAFELVERIDMRSAAGLGTTIEINKENFSIVAAAKRFRVPVATIRRRLKRNATPRQAVGIDPIILGDLQHIEVRKESPRTKQQYVVDGKSYKTVKALSEAYSLSPALVYNRMRDNKWDANRAVKEPVSKPVKIDGVTYRSGMSAWEEVGRTNYTTFLARQRDGHSLEISLGLAPLPALERYEVNAVTYPSLAALACAHDLTAGQLVSRLKTMSLEEALVYKPSNGRYSDTIFERDQALAATIGSLYFIKVSSTQGTLHKIGMTKRPLEVRFQGETIEIIAQFSGTLRDIHKVEQAIKRQFVENLYRSDEDFEGKTETFQLLENEEALMLDAIVAHVKNWHLSGSDYSRD
ncbi:GIY-YIG nuclease family protein [Massilia psychrophila]|nr:GIY-YIG nuclease family protein [Massilia psychrophila]GGE80142.1 hypothetical protein GCM10008020_26150 [Massilia psychrophila]